jgi:hypothetical protein
MILPGNDDLEMGSFLMDSPAGQNQVNGVTEGCSVELEPFWVLFATPRNNTAVVAIALDGKQVHLLCPSVAYSLLPCPSVCVFIETVQLSGPTGGQDVPGNVSNPKLERR